MSSRRARDAPDDLATGELWGTVGMVQTRKRNSRSVFFFQAEDGIRDRNVTGVQTCALPICRERLADVKCPRSVDFEQALPRAETGKLYKKELRARYWPEG